MARRKTNSVCLCSAAWQAPKQSANTDLHWPATTQAPANQDLPSPGHKRSPSPWPRTPSSARASEFRTINTLGCYAHHEQHDNITTYSRCGIGYLLGLALVRPLSCCRDIRLGGRQLLRDGFGAHRMDTSGDCLGCAGCWSFALLEPGCLQQDTERGRHQMTPPTLRRI
jgi:hypothetical protein